MFEKRIIIERIIESGVVAVIRAENSEQALLKLVLKVLQPSN